MIITVTVKSERGIEASIVFFCYAIVVGWTLSRGSVLTFG